MEETVAVPRRDQTAAPEGGQSQWLRRALPALVVLLTAGGFTLAEQSNLNIAYLAWDSRAYYDALRSPDPYSGAAVGVIGSYLYPPPFLQVLGPAARLPWPAFMFGWTALLAAAAVALLRRVPRDYRPMWPLLVVLAGADIWAGNINLLLAFGAVVALRLPATWAGLVLTKVTAGVGALWHAFRREWRGFAVAAGFTAALALVSYLAAPQLWADWLTVMVGENPNGAYAASIPIPLVVRLPAAVVVLWWAARGNHAWAVPAACLLALPVIWFNGLSLLLGSAALLEARPRPAETPAKHSAEPATA